MNTARPTAARAVAVSPAQQERVLSVLIGLLSLLALLSAGAAWLRVT